MSTSETVNGRVFQSSQNISDLFIFQYNHKTRLHKPPHVHTLFEDIKFLNLSTRFQGSTFVHLHI